MSSNAFLSGMPAVDQVSCGLQIGDNLVWRVNSIEVYRRVAQSIAARRTAHPGWKAVYFRFANHPPLLQEEPGIEIVRVSPERGFEHFITQIHRVIEAQGHGGIYIFDSLSDLQEIRYSDRMIGCFFRLTCPYLREMETIATFMLAWGVHSTLAIKPIRETTQVWLDGYELDGEHYLRAVKTRQGSGTYRQGVLFHWAPEGAEPLSNSALVSRIRQSVNWTGLPSSPQRQVDVWDRAFLRLQNVVEQIERIQAAGLEPAASIQEEHEKLRRLTVRMMMTNEEAMAQFALKFINSRDILYIWRRMVGTGLIGGKAVGMLLARQILRYRKARVAEMLENHDSFYIGSDVFYTYLVDNDCWWQRQELKNPETFLKRNKEVHRRIMAGDFPEPILEEFRDLLDYYGASPIIVRSSSLLEDNYGNAFAGKYESIFCANQGSAQQRLEEFCLAVRRVYAGTMSTEALMYRRDRGVLERDEQMALLVQRVSGRRRGRHFFPDLAGTVVSYNAFAWHPDIDPEAGMARIVIGLGTRAVDRVAEDYPWVVSLNAPLRNLDREEHRSHQRHVDAVDLGQKAIVGCEDEDACKDQAEPGHGVHTSGQNLEATVQHRFAKSAGGIDRGQAAIAEVPLSGDPAQELDIPDFLFERDWRREREARRYGLDPRMVLEPSLNPLFEQTDFAEIFREAARVLRETYGTHIELEFTAQWEDWHGGGGKNGFGGNSNPPQPWINVLQCRPFQMRIDKEVPGEVPKLTEDRILVRISSPVIGRGRHIAVHALIRVDPAAYSRLDEEGHHRTARELGNLVRKLASEGRTIVMIGPGRWGTSTPAMGVPVRFSDIRQVEVLGEMDWMHPDLSPDISLGTHFFHDLVEADTLFLGLRRADPEFLYRLDEFVNQAWGTGECIFWEESGKAEPWWLFADPVRSTAVLYQRGMKEEGQ